MKKNTNNKNNSRYGKSIEKYKICSCGAKAKLRYNKNYPFGKNSKAVISQYYRCDVCQVRVFINTNKGGNRR